MCESIRVISLKCVIFIGSSCTSAALSGGITLIGAMPNTNPPITNQSHLKIAQKVVLQCSLVRIVITMIL